MNFLRKENIKANYLVIGLTAILLLFLSQIKSIPHQFRALSILQQLHCLWCPISHSRAMNSRAKLGSLASSFETSGCQILEICTNPRLLPSSPFASIFQLLSQPIVLRKWFWFRPCPFATRTASSVSASLVHTISFGASWTTGALVVAVVVAGTCGEINKRLRSKDKISRYVRMPKALIPPALYRA